MPSGRASISCTLPALWVWCCQHVTAPHPHLRHANPNQVLPLGFAVAVGLLGFLVTYLVAAQPLDEGLLARMNGDAAPHAR